MSYVRSKNLKGHDYLYVQRSVREGGRVKTQHVAYLGRGTRSPGGSPPPRELGTTIEAPPQSNRRRPMTPEERRRIEVITTHRRDIFSDPERRFQVKATERLSKRGFDTKKEYYDTQRGAYEPARAQYHREIVTELLDRPGSHPPPGKKPEVILLGGPPGSGKTETILKSIPNYKERYVIIDSDHIKSKLPEYRGYNASRVHEESGDIFEEAAAKAIKNRQNIILDATLKNSEKAKRKIATFRKLGYTTKVYGTNVDAEVSLERATQRFKKKGRYVPIEYIALHTETINKSVRDVATDADEYRVYDTSKGPGTPPRIILEGKSPRLDR